MKELTAAQIEKYASRKGVRRIAVENFLGTLDASAGARGNLQNLGYDAALYRWNLATQNAIESGIKAAFK